MGQRALKLEQLFETGAVIGKSKNRFTPTTQFTFLVSKKWVKEL